MDYKKQLLEDLMDKGFPYLEAINMMHLLGAFNYTIRIPDPKVCTTPESVDRYHKGWLKIENENAKSFLIYVKFMRPVWNQYENWQYNL